MVWLQWHCGFAHELPNAAEGKLTSISSLGKLKMSWIKGTGIFAVTYSEVNTECTVLVAVEKLYHPINLKKKKEKKTDWESD